MEYTNLVVTEENGIVFITLNRPKALNALNGRTMEELRHFFGTDGPARTGLKGVILAGAGDRAFVAGADIKEFLNVEPGKGDVMAQMGQDVFFLIERFHRPVVALIHGFALGGGCELAMACHLRIASEKSKFGQPEVNLGLIPGYGGTQRLIQYIGKTKALELILTGDMITAAEAYRLGLLNYVVPEDSMKQKAVELLEKIATKAPLAIAKSIACINAYFEAGVDGFAKEVQAFGEATSTKDFHEGAQAFIEKRKPDFKGI